MASFTSDSEGEAPVTFADLGLKSEAATVETFVGTRRPISSLTKFEWAFLIISVVSTLGALGLTIERIYTTVSEAPDSSDATFAVLLLINIVFIIFYIINGVFGERAFEVLAFVIGTFVLLLYCIINYVQTAPKAEELQIIKLTRLILISVFGPVDIIMGLLVARQYHESKNLIFRKVGANVILQEICTKVFLCESLLKFDLQLTMSLVFLILNDGLTNIGLEEQLVLGIGLSYCVFWIIIGWLAMRYESKPLSWIFLFTFWMQPAYIIWKLYDLGINWNHPPPLDSFPIAANNVTASPAPINDENAIAATIIMCSFFGLVLRASVVTVFILVYRNFGRGLKEKILNISTQEETSKVVTPQ